MLISYNNFGEPLPKLFFTFVSFTFQKIPKCYTNGCFKGINIRVQLH